MKHAAITPGSCYTDHKKGLRQVLEIGAHIPTLGALEQAVGVRYRVLAAAKQTDVGVESNMELKSFAGWAKAKFTEKEADAFILSQSAGRVLTRLTPPQRAFLRSIDLDATEASSIECNRSEMRVAKSCQEKGLLTEIPATAKGDDTFDVSLTKLGLTVLYAVHEEDDQ